MTRRLATWGRVQRGCAVALVVSSLAFVGLRASSDRDFPFLPRDEVAPWISVSSPVSARLEQWGREEAPRVVFHRAFAAASGQTARIEMRALRQFELQLNGESLAQTGGEQRWRPITVIDLEPFLRDGRNEVRIEVRNLHGPALLSLRSEGLEPPLHSAAGWRVSVDGRDRGNAVAASDTRVNPSALGVESPRGALRNKGSLLLGLVAAAGFLIFALRPYLDASRSQHLPRVALAVAIAAWLALFITKFVHLPIGVGFDANNHLAYVEFLRNRPGLPTAVDGWSLYHPPLFYLATQLLAWIGDQIASGTPSLSLKWIPFASGLGNIVVASALGRRLFPDDFRVPLVATVFAAVLPMNLYGSAYFSNEMPHAFLVGLGLVLTVGALQSPRVEMRQVIWLGAAFGLAALTKFTAVIVLPIALFFLGAKLVAVESAGARRSFRLVGASGLVAIALAGWFYARNWVEFGAPLIGNWNIAGPGRIWWQQPGFHTLGYYTGFGESLVHPYLAGFHSFWDGIYSTLWGDGGIAGRVFPAQRHSLWSYEFMSIGFWIGLPATGLVLYGALRGLRLAVTAGDPGQRAALSFLLTAGYAVGLAILYLTLQLPFFAQAKAFYGLCMAGPLALFFALGVTGCDDALSAPPLRPVRGVFHACLIAAATLFFLGFIA